MTIEVNVEKVYRVRISGEWIDVSDFRVVECRFFAAAGITHSPGEPWFECRRLKPSEAIAGPLRLVEAVAYGEKPRSGGVIGM